MKYLTSEFDPMGLLQFKAEGDIPAGWLVRLVNDETVAPAEQFGQTIGTVVGSSTPGTVDVALTIGRNAVWVTGPNLRYAGAVHRTKVCYDRADTLCDMPFVIAALDKLQTDDVVTCLECLAQ